MQIMQFRSSQLCYMAEKPTFLSKKIRKMTQNNCFKCHRYHCAPGNPTSDSAELSAFIKLTCPLFISALHARNTSLSPSNLPAEQAESLLMPQISLSLLQTPTWVERKSLLPMEYWLAYSTRHKFYCFYWLSVLNDALITRDKQHQGYLGLRRDQILILVHQ